MNSNILARCNVHEMGSGRKTLVFGNGFGCTQGIWRRLVPSFESRYRVVLFDYAPSEDGALQIDESGRLPSLDDYARNLLDVCRALELRDAVFVGHSVSSAIGLLASIAEPKVFDRLVLLAPSPRYLNDPPDYFGGFERRDVDELLALMEQNFLGWAQSFAGVAARQAWLEQELFERFSLIDPAYARHFCEITLKCDIRAELPEVTRPCLVLQCSNDDVCPVAVGEYMHRHLSDSTYRVLDVSGHCPQMSDPDLVASAIGDYLRRVA